MKSPRTKDSNPDKKMPLLEYWAGARVADTGSVVASEYVPTANSDTCHSKNKTAAGIRVSAAAGFDFENGGNCAAASENLDSTFVSIHQNKTPALGVSEAGATSAVVDNRSSIASKNVNSTLRGFPKTKTPAIEQPGAGEKLTDTLIDVREYNDPKSFVVRAIAAKFPRHLVKTWPRPVVT